MRWLPSPSVMDLPGEAELALALALALALRGKAPSRAKSKARKKTNVQSKKLLTFPSGALRFGRRGGIRTRDPLHPIHFWVDFGGFPWINKIL
ncbi:hypothetical protein [Delftia acidovorans]|uniref:hypothetical protein n=2 Tax=Delftia acidovorans TaxID=80866 RepID=UPI00359FAF33